MERLKFDPSDEAGITRLISEHEKYPDMFFGEDESGCVVSIEVTADKVTTRTSQSNGWTRVNVYWLDGTREETYEM